MNLLHLLMDTYNQGLYQVNHKELAILFVAGEKDPIIVSEEKWYASQQFLKERGYVNVSCHLYPNLRHEILMEENKKEVYEDILVFLLK